MLPILLQSITGVNNVPDFLVQLEQFGLLDAVLPFILIFAILFTVLSKTNVVSDKKNIHMLVSLVISLLVILPHVMGTYPPGQDVVNIINNALPNMALVIVIIVAALIVMGIFRAPGDTGVPGAGLMVPLSAIVIIYIFGLAAGWWKSLSFLSFLNNPDIQALVVIVLVFGLVIFLITSDSPMDDARSIRSLLTGRPGP
jgi:hypothetical protein